MKAIVLSHLEKKILLLFVIGFAIGGPYLHFPFSTWVLLYVFGMSFEFLTEPAWNYNPILYKSTFTLRDRDVNWIFGLGWQATLALGLSLGKWFEQTFTLMQTLPNWCLASLGLGLVGNVMEQIFLKLGLWEYNLNNWICTIWTRHAIMVGRIPLAVRLGYFGMGAIVWVLAYRIAPMLGTWWEKFL